MSGLLGGLVQVAAGIPEGLIKGELTARAMNREDEELQRQREQFAMQKEQFGMQKEQFGWQRQDQQFKVEDRQQVKSFQEALTTPDIAGETDTQKKVNKIMLAGYRLGRPDLAIQHATQVMGLGKDSVELKNAQNVLATYQKQNAIQGLIAGKPDAYNALPDDIRTGPKIIKLELDLNSTNRGIPRVNIQYEGSGKVENSDLLAFSQSVGWKEGIEAAKIYIEKLHNDRVFGLQARSFASGEKREKQTALLAALSKWTEPLVEEWVKKGRELGDAIASGRITDPQEIGKKRGEIDRGLVLAKQGYRKLGDDFVIDKGLVDESGNTVAIPYSESGNPVAVDSKGKIRELNMNDKADLQELRRMIKIKNTKFDVKKFNIVQSGLPYDFVMAYRNAGELAAESPYSTGGSTRVKGLVSTRK